MMKYTVLALVSALFFASNLGKNGFGAEGIALDLASTTCEAGQTGNGTVTMFGLTGCQNNMTCTVWNGTMQQVSLTFDPVANYTGNRMVYWEAVLETLVLVKNVTVATNYIGNTPVTEMLEFTAPPSGVYPMRLQVREDDIVIACRQIPLTVIDTVPVNNTGTSVGGSCQMVGQPCDFAYSNCMTSGTDSPMCGCIPDATENDGMCKVRANGFCSADSNCVANSKCTEAMCKCDDKILDAALGTCSGVGALVSTSALLFMIQLVAYAFK